MMTTVSLSSSIVTVSPIMGELLSTVPALSHCLQRGLGTLATATRSYPSPTVDVFIFHVFDRPMLVEKPEILTPVPGVVWWWKKLQLPPTTAFRCPQYATGRSAPPFQVRDIPFVEGMPPLVRAARRAPVPGPPRLEDKTSEWSAGPSREVDYSRIRGADDGFNCGHLGVHCPGYPNAVRHCLGSS